MKFGRTLAWYFYAYMIGGIATWISNLLFMGTLCCAVFGEYWGLLAGECIRCFLWPLVAFWVIYLPKRKDVTLKQEYLHQKEGASYCFHTDVVEILCDSVFWKEFAIAFLLTLVYALFNPLLMLINVPMFLLFNLFSLVHLHRTWIRDRFRL